MMGDLVMTVHFLPGTESERCVSALSHEGPLNGAPPLL